MFRIRESLVDERTDGCETVKGGFFASFHMETLVFRLLGSSDGSECGYFKSLSNGKRLRDYV